MSKEQEEYYAPCTSDYRSVDNRAAREEWFYATEPNGELPKHTTILHVDKAEAIMAAFVNRIRVNVIKNAVFGWNKATTLPNKRAKIQPLADA